MEGLAQRIRTLRQAHGMTQEQLAVAVGVTKSAVSGWERGEVDNIKLANFLRLCRVLHTQPQYLVFGPSGEFPRLNDQVEG